MTSRMAARAVCRAASSIWVAHMQYVSCQCQQVYTTLGWIVEGAWQQAGTELCSDSGAWHLRGKNTLGSYAHGESCPT